MSEHETDRRETVQRILNQLCEEHGATLALVVIRDQNDDGAEVGVCSIPDAQEPIQFVADTISACGNVLMTVHSLEQVLAGMIGEPQVAIHDQIVDRYRTLVHAAAGSSPTAGVTVKRVRMGQTPDELGGNVDVKA